MNPNSYPVVHAVDGPRRPAGPWRLLWYAVLFMLLAGVVQFIGVFAVGVGLGFTQAFAAKWVMPAIHRPSWLLPVAAILTLHGSLAVIGWKRGRKLGGGDVRAGLGLLPMRNVPTFLVLVPLTALGVVIWLTVLQSYLPGHRSSLSRVMAPYTSSPVIDLGITALLIGVVPMISEEVFFRGWLWVALSRWWRPLPVGVATTGLWLFAHAPDGWVRPLFLLPIGVSLAYLRHRCGSLKASMALHLINNLAVVAVLFALRLR